MASEQTHPGSTRNVVLGVNSAIWQQLTTHAALTGFAAAAIGHRELRSFSFTPSDTVWVLSYSKNPADNIALLDYLASQRVQRIVYVTSSSAIVTSITRCYRYPLTKHLAETHASTLPNATILTIGMMYLSPDELAGGPNIATSYDELAAFMAAPSWPETGIDKHLFRVVQRPFRSGVEQFLHRSYGRLQQLCGSRPCLLRPLDLLLKLAGIRWYGYVYLSNRLWISTIS